MDLRKKIRKINCLFAEIDALYHRASLKIAISDSRMIILYFAHQNGECCLLKEIYQQSGISKQTINSALRKLEDEKIIFLEKTAGRGKNVLLTEKGKLYVQETVAKIYNAELAVLSRWTEEELATHIHLMEKYINDFSNEIKNIR